MTSIYDMAQEADSRFLKCRDIRHVWKDEPLVLHEADPQRKIADGYPTLYARRDLRCERCDTVRREVWAFWERKQLRTRFERVSVYYLYPEGYQFTGADEREHTADAVRHALWGAQIEHLRRQQ